ncbi:MAG: SufD family Fe-S cluster assembly protein [Alphaproteobacteria bacterium]|nr:SufD family Fe-S cluster assembly protein [Alphaproteobacteria bacterium]
MTSIDELPSRRVEGWRWTDLRSALAGHNPPMAEGDRHVIARLAQAAGRMSTRVVASGESSVEIERLGGAALDVQALEFDVREGADLTLIVLQAGAETALSHRKIRLGERSVFRQFVLMDGGSLARIETDVEIAGAGATVEMSAVYLAAAGKHADLTSRVDLRAEGAIVRQLVRGAARKGGRGVFQGKFHVGREAQKTDARMKHNALLLEEGAEVFAKPELEIYADDVQCAHGNTAGQLDEAAIFYLRSRGIPDAQARAMITRAFLFEAIPDWLDAAVRTEAEGRIDAWLEAAP